MKSCMFRAALLLPAIAVAGVIGLAAPGSVALAQASQGGKNESDAAASKPGGVAGVVVQAPPKLNRIPPAKKAALDAEAAKRKTWQKYRTTTPSTPAHGTEPASTTAAARAENYPGLHDLGSH
jgi:hypothetical protein